jgi:hypothetical protein
MHIAYVQAGGRLDCCPLCVEAQADPTSGQYRDADHRIAPPLPCPEHGDPAFCTPANFEALTIYRRLNNGNHIYQTYAHGEQQRQHAHLDVKLAIMLCQVYAVDDIPATLDKLDIIHAEIYRS